MHLSQNLSRKIEIERTGFIVRSAYKGPPCIIRAAAVAYIPLKFPRNRLLLRAHNFLGYNTRPRNRRHAFRALEKRAASVTIGSIYLFPLEQHERGTSRSAHERATKKRRSRAGIQRERNFRIVDDFFFFCGKWGV